MTSSSTVPETGASAGGTYLSDLFDLDLLEQMVGGGYVRIQDHPDLPLRILNYTPKTQVEGNWNTVTLACRGLIVDADDKVVARPFRKFFNYTEHPDGSFDPKAWVIVNDKMDGSLGILYPTPSGHAIATRGSFTSPQALHATQVWNERYADQVTVHPNLTVLFEIVFPENRIVVDYGDLDDLVLLGGVHIDNGQVVRPSRIAFPGPRTSTFTYPTLAAALTAPPRPGKEGLVVRLLDTQVMVKIKQDDYIALHKIVTGLNARVVWEHLGNGGSIGDLCAGLPDEFHEWVRNTGDHLAGRNVFIAADAVAAYDAIVADLPAGWGRAEFAAAAKQSPHRALLFLLFDGKDIFPAIWKTLKPAADDRPLHPGQDA